MSIQVLFQTPQKPTWPAQFILRVPYSWKLSHSLKKLNRFSIDTWSNGTKGSLLELTMCREGASCAKLMSLVNGLTKSSLRSKVAIMTQSAAKTEITNLEITRKAKKKWHVSKSLHKTWKTMPPLSNPWSNQNHSQMQGPTKVSCKLQIVTLRK